MNKTLNHNIGFELEFEGCQFYENADLLRNKFDKFGDVKSDGSLSHGFELASKIYKINQFCGDSSNKSNNIWNSLFQKVNEVGGHSEHNTGMHVHVARKGLTVDDIIKINYFVFSSQKLMDLIGGRTENHWCYYIRNEESDVKINHGTKYRYLNTGHPNTIEFRFFRTPDTITPFLRNMQFICAIIEFVKTNDADSKFYRDKAQRNLLRFWDFVESNKECYNYLKAFLDLNQDKIKNGEICADKVVNCSLYPTQKAKISLSKFLVKRYGKTVLTVEELKSLIARYNPEKSPKTIAYLQRVLDRATSREAKKVYFNELPKVNPFDV